MDVHALTHVKAPYFDDRLWNSIIYLYIKTKVLFKFGSLEIVCVEMRPKKANQIVTKPILCKVTVQHHCMVCWTDIELHIHVVNK